MSITAARSFITIAVALCLVVLAGSATSNVHAGPGSTAVFAPTPLNLLYGENAGISVQITKDLTDDEAEDGVINADLILPGGTDTILVSKAIPVPGVNLQEGQRFTVPALYSVRCTDEGEVVVDSVPTGESYVELFIEFEDPFPDETADGSGEIECIAGALVEFDPDPLEIPEGQTRKVRATVTKALTALEANPANRTVNLRLAELGEDTFLGTTGANQVKLAGAQVAGRRVTFSWRFQLKCEFDEVIGIENTEKDEAHIAIEFEEGGEQWGDGTVRCVEPRTSSVGSGGSHPSDVFVDEETGLAYALNAFDGAIGVFDGDQQVDTLQLPCPYVPAGASSVEPGGFNCVYQSMRLHYFPPQVGFAIYAADFQAALIVVMFFGQTSSIAGTPDTITSIAVGDSPSDIAYDPLHDRLYVANSGDGTVSVINPDPGVVEDTIATGGSPGQIAVDGVNGFAYVTDFTGDQVFVINTSTNAVVDTLPAGDGPDGIVLDPDTGDLYVTNYIDDTLSIMSQATRAPASLPTTVPTGNGPIEVDVNPLTDRIFVANGIDDTVTVIDRSTRMVAATIPVGLTPDDVTVDREDGLVYVANHDVNTLTIIEDPSPYTERQWGDLNCDDTVDVADALVDLRLIGSIFEFNGDDCPAPGAPVQVRPPEYGEQIWADSNCDTELDTHDPLRLLLFLAGVASAPTALPGCPSVDESVDVW